MAIDGRTLKPQDPKPANGADAYEHSGVRIVSVLVIAIPAVALIAFLYWTGTYFGGFWGGVSSVVSTAATVWVLWVMKRRRQR